MLRIKYNISDCCLWMQNDILASTGKFPWVQVHYHVTPAPALNSPTAHHTQININIIYKNFEFVKNYLLSIIFVLRLRTHHIYMYIYNIIIDYKYYEY